MDYSKFFARRTTFRTDNLIRRLTKIYYQNPGSVNLGSGMPNTTLFPFQNLSFTNGDKTTTLTPQELATALQYGPSPGYLPLLQKWKDFQKNRHNPLFENWGIAIVPGSQDGFYKVLDMIIEEGDPIMVQAPGYTGTIAAVHAMAPEYIGIPQDADGIIPAEIEKICSERRNNNKKLPKALCVNPIGANPTGTVLTTDRKREIYQLAKKYDFLIIEDDPYYFVHFLDSQPPSFLSMDTDGRVIRLDTFSKIISSGLRLGVVTAHTEVIDKLIVSIQNTVLHASSLSQMLLFKLLDDWTTEEFENHIKKVQTFYKSQRDVMIKCLKIHLEGLAEWTVPNAGMFIWIKLKTSHNALNLLMDKLIPNGVFMIPGSAFNYEDTPDDHHLRLCYSFSTEEEINRALEVLVRFLRENITPEDTKAGTE
ncbi:kynurenine/alpha-aminoadipate aminotransferase, mitochondrial-like [Diachasmimorpha longicaudata]|uniref:kynurenine/alpha-aminoadipate aminotransferase, mitochondrial-like n=1 Tax=Diachasmimorpha longicaudata TaxID=58733 RepID=UPI0030B91C22